MRFFEVDSAVDAIMSAAMLAQTKAGSRNQQGKLSMNGFLQMLKNAGIIMDYEGFKTVYDTNPQLANVISKFDKDSITFLSADGDDKAVDNTKPSNQTPPDERITQMARKAVKTREFVESVVTEGAIDTLRAIVDNKQNMPVKFADGQMKVDLFSASAITKVYDAVNDANKEKLERMMQTKAGMLRVQDFAMDQVKMESQEVDESGILYKAGIKKYGEKGMKKIQSAAGSGASAEEIGKIKDQYNKKKKMNADIHEDEKDDAKLMIEQLKVISEHRRMLENMIIKLAELNKSSGDLTDQLQTMFDLNTKFSAVLRRSMSIVPTYEGISEDEKYNADSSGKFEVTFSNEDMDPKTEAQYLNILKMLLKTYKNVDISDIDDVESYIMIRGLSVQEAAIPTSEYDYDLMKFLKKVKELEDENQHGEVAKMLTQLYGTSSELMIINGINGMHSKEGSIGPEAQKLRDKISTKYYYKLEQEAKKLKSTSPAYTMKKEGFASDAQRKAAFASGYKPTGKKKKTETKTKNIDFGRMISGKGPKPKDVKTESMQSKFRNFLAEGMKEKIAKDIENGMSTDAIIGKHANKRTDNTDEIRKIIKDIKFKERMKKGKK